MGSGDKVPESLSLVGYNVDLFEKKDINAEKLKNYDALIIGVRAFGRICLNMTRLFEAPIDTAADT